MAIESGGQAPYAPPANVIEIINRYRDHGLETPFTVEVLTRAGITEALAPRVLKALKQLDLIDGGGQPTEQFEQLAKAAGDEFPDRFTAIIRAAYEPVFRYADPAKSPERVPNAFRHFEPRGQRGRMVTLFFGLCEYAGIIEAAPKRVVAQQPTKRREPKPRQRSTSNGKAQKTDPLPRSPIMEDFQPKPNPILAGLFSALPPIPPDWPQSKSTFAVPARKAWLRAAEANLSVIYELAPGDGEGGEDD